MKPEVFVPFSITPRNGLTFVMRTSNDAAAQVAPARQVVRALDADMPMYDVYTMSEKLSRSLWVRRSYSLLFMAFASSAILLAAAGIYGVVSFAVSQRTREIGIRIALGARPWQLMTGVLGGGMMLVAVGVVLGSFGSMIAAGLLTRFLLGGSARDFATYAGVTLLVTAIGALEQHTCKWILLSLPCEAACRTADRMIWFMAGTSAAVEP